MNIIQQEQAHGVSVNEAAALILKHSVVTPGVTPTGSCLGVLRVEDDTHNCRLSLSTYMLSSSFLLFWCDSRSSIAARSATPVCAFVSQLICTFKSHHGGCFKYVEGCANICRTKTLNWLMTLRRASSTLSLLWLAVCCSSCLRLLGSLFTTGWNIVFWFCLL